VKPLNQSKSNVTNIKADQFLYCDRWVDKKGFRAFVYNDKGEQKLAESYEDYLDLTGSGLWLEKKPELQKGKRNVPVRAASQ
jgi:hypothetical protein